VPAVHTRSARPRGFPRNRVRICPTAREGRLYFGRGQRREQAEHAQPMGGRRVSQRESNRHPHPPSASSSRVVCPRSTGAPAAEQLSRRAHAGLSQSGRASGDSGGGGRDFFVPDPAKPRFLVEGVAMDERRDGRAHHPSGRPPAYAVAAARIGACGLRGSGLQRKGDLRCPTPAGQAAFLQGALSVSRIGACAPLSLVEARAGGASSERPSQLPSRLPGHGFALASAGTGGRPERLLAEEAGRCSRVRRSRSGSADGERGSRCPRTDRTRLYSSRIRRAGGTSDERAGRPQSQDGPAAAAAGDGPMGRGFLCPGSGPTPPSYLWRAQTGGMRDERSHHPS